MIAPLENIAQSGNHENFLTPNSRVRHLSHLQSTLENYKHPPTPTEPTQIRIIYEVQANTKYRKALASQAQFLLPSLSTQSFTPPPMEERVRTGVLIHVPHVGTRRQAKGGPIFSYRESKRKWIFKCIIKGSLPQKKWKDFKEYQFTFINISICIYAIYI